ncbi:hypothetical protein [Vibrio sp. D431a]|uniref:hypothetical protein n=1 Tax=Vibrio sp. D431a TaxID=2837388 RepID=UPI0025565AB2|nr:hypothetical protein [Vibrio sp. D431a]MDK9790701.1 hypothetical protein [Vibrio sp. D431a]
MKFPLIGKKLNVGKAEAQLGEFNQLGEYQIKSYFKCVAVDRASIDVGSRSLDIDLCDNEVVFQEFYRCSIPRIRTQLDVGESVSLGVYFVRVFRSPQRKNKGYCSAAKDSLIFYDVESSCCAAAYNSEEEAVAAINSYPETFDVGFNQELVKEDQCYISIDLVCGAQTERIHWYKLANGVFEPTTVVPELKNEGLFHQPKPDDCDGYLIETFKFGSLDNSTRQWFDMNDEPIECPFDDDEDVYSYSV